MLQDAPVWWGSFVTTDTRRGDTPETRRKNRGIEVDVWPMVELPLLARGLGWGMNAPLVQLLVDHVNELTDRVWAEDNAFGIWVYTVSQRTSVCWVFDYRWSFDRSNACAKEAHAIHTKTSEAAQEFAGGVLN